MITYISILRGINVSGQKLIKMEALKATYEKLGFTSVTTYIQSGNVLFKSDSENAAELEQKIAKQIVADFGFEVAILVLTSGKLKQIIDANPFGGNVKKNPAWLHVTFLSSKPATVPPESIEPKKSKNEEIYIGTDAVYMYCPHGYGKSKLNNNFFEKQLKVSATTRNWNTTNELYKMSQQLV